MKKIGFISTRIAGTDGVTLEIYKWYQVLERKGYSCYFFAGELDTPPDRSFLEPKAHFEDPEIKEVHDACVGTRTRKISLSKKIQDLKNYLKDRLYEYCKQFDIDIIIPENALAIPMNIPLGIAITEMIAETGMPAVAHHHDFSWERNRYLINSIEDYLNNAFPPTLTHLRHVVINTSASRQLSYRRGISNVIIPNVFDFEHPAPSSPNGVTLRKELGLGKDDLFVLQPTRVVPRKWIERSVELVNLMEVMNPKLVVSHESGDEGDLYANRVIEYAQRLGVEVVYMGDKVGSARCFREACEKKYTIDDVYFTADLVSYPSGYEGFGNAFIEAIYFKKPIVVNRYSIFIEDIEPCGFNVIPFEGFITKDVVDHIRDFLDPKNMNTLVEKNYELGRKYFSYKVLEEKLLPLIESFW